MHAVMSRWLKKWLKWPLIVGGVATAAVVGVKSLLAQASTLDGQLQRAVALRMAEQAR